MALDCVVSVTLSAELTSDRPLTDDETRLWKKPKKGGKKR